MANNYCQATITPDLPASAFSEYELQALSAACGLQWERSGDLLYFYAEEHFCEEGEDQDDRHINGIEMLQKKLQQLDPAAYPHIVIEGAATCSKMRPGEFGGFAFVITRDDIRYMATWQWLNEMTTKKSLPPSDESGLLAALKAILPYAESEAEYLAECHKRDGGLELQPHVEACQTAIAEARSMIELAEGRAA